MYWSCGSLTARMPNGFSHFASWSSWATAGDATVTARATTRLKRDTSDMTLSGDGVCGWKRDPTHIAQELGRIRHPVCRDLRPVRLMHTFGDPFSVIPSQPPP